jgi:Xaa-Pro aminopeptidase
VIVTRLERLRGELAARELDGFLVTDILNVRYLSGFTGSDAVALVTTDDAILITDFRYAEQSAAECPGMILELVESHWAPGAQRSIEKHDCRRIGFETHQLSYHDWSVLSAALSPGNLVPQEDLVGKLRLVKDELEIAAIREAVRIADLAYGHIVEFLKPGLPEREIAIELDYFMRRNGADKEGFDSIVASGPRSALPHGRSSDRHISKGELIVLDYGAVCQGYHSDITRTVVIGAPDARQQEIYGVVLEAQSRAISAVSPGLSGGEVDAVAREYIAGRGFGEYFGHGLGHGLGLDVHDGRILARNSEVMLESGMVVTVEPGIYIPGWGGVRIEDDVLVTDTGAEVLTRSPKTLSIG